MAAVLTVANGLPEGVVTRVEVVQDLLSHMTGNRIFLHQIPRAKDVCQKYLRDEFDWLDGMHPTAEQMANPDKLRRWARACEKARGETVAVQVLPGDAYTYMDPIIENVFNAKATRAAS